MSQQFDDLCRMLASPMPRRQSLRLFAGAIAGIAMSGLWTRQAMAAAAGLCTKGNCGPGAIPCPLGCEFGPSCCAPSETRCGNCQCCDANHPVCCAFLNPGN